MFAALLLALLPQAQPPSFVKIVLDDFGWDLLNPSAAPELDALAQTGLRFRQFYTQSTCSTTRYQMDFGRWAWTQGTLVPTLVPPSTTVLAPANGGIGDLPFNASGSGSERIPLDAYSIFEALACTHRVNLVGKWHLGRAPLLGEMNQVPSGPYCQGVESWRAGSDTVIGTGGLGYYQHQTVYDGDRFVSTVYATDEQADEALSRFGFLQASGEPFFLEIGFSAPHQPWDVPPEGGTVTNDRDRLELVTQHLSKRLAEVFAAIGPDVYVVLMSDNGTDDIGRPPLAPSGRWKGSPYQGGINSPMIWWGPGIAPGDTARLVSSVDVPATMLEIALLEQAPAFEHSVSFADELRPGIFLGAPQRDFLCVQRFEVVGSPAAFPQPAGYDCKVIVEREITPGIQLKWIIQDVDGNGPGSVVDTVYNLKLDPFELLGGSASLLPPGLRNRLESELASVPPRL